MLLLLGSDFHNSLIFHHISFVHLVTSVTFDYCLCLVFRRKLSFWLSTRVDIRAVEMLYLQSSREARDNRVYCIRKTTTKTKKKILSIEWIKIKSRTINSIQKLNAIDEGIPTAKWQKQRAKEKIHAIKYLFASSNRHQQLNGTHENENKHTIKRHIIRPLDE